MTAESRREWKARLRRASPCVLCTINKRLVSAAAVNRKTVRRPSGSGYPLVSPACFKQAKVADLSEGGRVLP